MSTINQFYTLDVSSSIHLRDAQLNGAIDLGMDKDHQVIGVKTAKNQWDILSMSNDSLQKWKFDQQFKAKPLFIEHDHDFIIFYESSQQRIIIMSISNRNQQASYSLVFKPNIAFSLRPRLNATLLIGVGNCQSCYLVIMNDTREPIKSSQSLSRLLHPYSHIICASHYQEKLAIVCQQHQQQYILIIGLRDEQQQQGRKQFALIDRFQLSNSIDKIHIKNEKLIVCHSGHLIDIVDLNTREVTKVKHSFKLFKVKQVFLISQTRMIIQDYTRELYILELNQNNEINTFYHTSDITSIYLLNQKFALIQQLENTISAASIGAFSLDDALTKLLDYDSYTALQIMRATGLGKQMYLKYQFNQTGCNNIQMMREYLQESDETSEELIKMLKVTPNLNKTIFELVVAEASNRCNNIEIEEKILSIKQRLSAFKQLEELRGKQILSLADFSVNLSILEIIDEIVKSHESSNHNLQDSIELIFKFLDFEVALNYEQCLHRLPLEYLEPKFLMRFLPPGLAKPNKFWQLFNQLNDQKSINVPKLYKDVCQEYIEEVQQPGKALIIMQEAAQRMGVIGLTNLAMKAVNKIYSPSSDMMELSTVIKGTEDSIQIDLQLIQSYFDKAKWIFVMENIHYQRYISQLKELVMKFIRDQKVDFSLTFLQSLVQFSSENLLFLKDQDLCQMTLAIIYESNCYTYIHLDDIQRVFQSLQELSLSPNQSAFLRQYLFIHIKLQTEYLTPYTVEVSFRQLMMIQNTTDPDSSEIVSKVTNILTSMLENKIKKVKNVKEQVRAFSQQDQQSTLWIATLQEMLSFKDEVAKQSQIDVYSLFIKRLLDNRVTSSIEQLIKSQLFPIDELQTTVLRYLQDQFNVCDSENFYNFGQTSKQFITLLSKYDPANLHKDNLEKELKLLELSFYFKQHKILIGQLSNTQIRSDYGQNRLVDRYLQIHGFKDFPETFEILMEIQYIINPSLKSSVVVKILKHLNQIKVFENMEQKPLYTQKMIQQIILNRFYKKDKVDFSWVNEEGISDIFFKIALISNEDQTFKKDLMKFLVSTCDKRQDLYYFICKELLPPRPSPFTPPSFVSELKFAMSHNLLSKANNILLSHFGEQQSKSKDVFCSLLESCTDLTFSEVKQLASVMNQDLAQLKQLSGLDNSEIARLIRDPESFQLHISQQSRPRNQHKHQEEEEQEEEFMDATDTTGIPIKDLMNSQELIDAEMIVDMEYTDWNQNVDIDKIIQDMGSHHIQKITQNAFEAILVKISVDETKAERMRQLYQSNSNINVLLIAKDLQLPQNNHFESLLTSNQTALVKDFRKQVSDVNLMKLSMSLENLNESYPILLAVCLYVNKLEMLINNLSFIERMAPQQIQNTFYQLIDKDTMEELIENNDYDPIIHKLNTYYRQKINRNVRPEVLRAVMIE